MTTPLLDAAPEVEAAVGRTGRSCAVVASGTSRFLVLADDPHADDAARAELARRLVTGRAPTVGLGDAQYQANKVVLVQDPDSDGHVRFRFLQVTGPYGAVQARMECPNAAPAAAVWTLLRGGSSGTGGDPVRLTNVGTGQRVVLEPPASWWSGDWVVRFGGLEGLAEVLAETSAVEDVGGVLTHVVAHGHVFVLATVDPDRVTSALLDALVAAGQAHQVRHGLPPGVVKVVLHVPDGEGPTGRPTWRAACFSGGTRHRSLPGSAAMTLAASLTARGLARASIGPGRGAASVVSLQHPSGEMTVRVDLGDGTDPASVVAASFFTPVQLLLAGTALV